MKAKIVIALVSMLLIIAIPTAAVSAALEVDVDVGTPELIPLTDQTIIATANERGVGILIVLQPATGAPWADFLDAHPALKSIFNQLPTDIQNEIISEIGNKIVSYKIVGFGTGGGSATCVFPDDFTGINGEPSTEAIGEYGVLFAYISWEADVQECCCCCVRIEFDCDFGIFNVIPEVPFGTVMIISSMGLAVFGYITIKKPRKNKTA